MSRSDDSYTAIVYFHGIGNQRRHQEIGRLIDALDRYSYFQDDETTIGRLGAISAEYELSRTEPDGKDIAYVQAEHRQRSGPGYDKATFRFYEGYWASLNRTTYSIRELFTWSLRKGFRPLRPLLSEWRAEPRLRRRSLHQLAATGKKPADSKDVRRLLEAYDEFEGPEQRRCYPKGRFGDYLDSLPEDEPQRQLARRWRSAFIQYQIKAFGMALTLLVAVLVGALAAVYGVLQILEAFSRHDLASELGDQLNPSWLNAMAVAGVLAVSVGGSRLASQLLGDVVGWATYRETDPRYEVREAILDQAVDLLRHVLLDPRAERVIVIGHSLGTTIAYDALLTVGLQHEAAGSAGADRVGQLEKLDQFITLGSPIDLVHSMTESHRGPFHRYVRLEESLRGNIGSAPFSPIGQRRKPHMHWINIWDRFDPIATPLYSPNDKRGGAMPVDNFRTNSLVAPDPAASHGSYFFNRVVVGIIFEAAFLEKYSYRQGKPKPIGNESDRKRASLGVTAMLAFPWLGTALILARVFSAPSILAETLTWAIVVIAAGLLGILVVARVVGVRPSVGAEQTTADTGVGP